MVGRYLKYSNLANNYFLSKQNLYSVGELPRLKRLSLTAGHYKLNSLFVEHGLIFLALTGNIPELSFFLHGKRLKKTVTLQTMFFNKNGLAILDKLVNLIIPGMEDLTLTSQRRAVNNLYYEWRVRCYFEDLGSSGFISDRLTKQDTFMPLLLSATFHKGLKATAGKLYLRMLRLPLLK